MLPEDYERERRAREEYYGLIEDEEQGDKYSSSDYSTDHEIVKASKKDIGHVTQVRVVHKGVVSSITEK